MFRYLKDPLFLAAMAAYVLNRFLVKPHLPPTEVFFRGYFNDLLLIPAVLPAILYFHKRTGLRLHDRCPTMTEIVLHLVIWSLVLEWFGPDLFPRTVGDFWDVVVYCAGGFGAWLIWRHRQVKSFRPPAPTAVG